MLFHVLISGTRIMITMMKMKLTPLVAFSLGPFGMSLHYQYKILKPAPNHASCSEVSK